MGWRSRYKIAVGIVKGAGLPARLHHSPRVFGVQWIVHCDVKAANEHPAGLRAQLELKISDMGLVNLLSQDGPGRMVLD